MSTGKDTGRGGAPADEFAVIVVNFRTADLAIACVESLLRSDGVRIRVFVVDNSSGDGSADRMRAALANHAEVEVIARTVNDGYAGGNNAGIAAARGAGARFAVVLNPDTTVEPDCLRLLVAELAAHPDAAVATPCIFYGQPPDLLWFGGGRYSRWRGRAVHVGAGHRAEAGWGANRDLDFATGCAMLLRLDALRAAEYPFDPSLFTYAEDLDLSLRLRRAGYRLRYVPGAVVHHFEGLGHRGAGGQPVRWYFSTRNLLRVAWRHARWYERPILAPMLAVNVVLRYALVAARRGNRADVAAVLRGARDALTGGRHSLERAAESATRN